MDGKRLIHRLRLQNLLSFGSEGGEIELRPLNVLIGANASGKSNLIEAISLLRATPRDLPAPIRAGGGIDEWLWKGGPAAPVASIEAVIDYPAGGQPLRYRLGFTSVGQRLELVDEAIENNEPDPSDQETDVYYRHQGGRPVLSVRATTEEPVGTSRGRTHRVLQPEDLRADQSVFAQLKDPAQFPELTDLGNRFGAIRLFREWTFGQTSLARSPARTDLPNDFLLEDASNLGLVLNAVQQRHRPTWTVLLDKLRLAYEGVEDLTIFVEGGTVQVFLHERDLETPVPATRLSDGTLRYLALLTILLHPKPPPLICLEEPELGLHPDLMLTLAGLLLDATQRTQLIVTTHAVPLISALSQVPEAVVVCERDLGGTRLSRLDSKQLDKWLERYTLGELWQMGEVGGNRW